MHLSYVREGAGHALIGARQQIPAEHIDDPVRSLVMGLPPDLQFRTKGQLAIDISTDAAADGIRPDFYCGDEVYGNCTQLRGHFEAEGQAYVLRVPSNFMITLAAGTKLTCADAVKSLLKHSRRWEVRSAGSGSKGERWYAWAWLATASARHHLLIRRHLTTGATLSGSFAWSARRAGTWETGETCVVWLITQRSRVQIPPPLPRPEAPSRTEKGPSACGLLTDT